MTRCDVVGTLVPVRNKNIKVPDRLSDERFKLTYSTTKSTTRPTPGVPPLPRVSGFPFRERITDTQLSREV